MIELKPNLVTYPKQNNYSLNLPGVMDYKGRLSLCLGNSVFKVTEYEFEKLKMSPHEVSIPLGWDKIEVSLAGIGYSILIPEKTYKKLNTQVEILEVTRILEFNLKKLKNTPKNESFNITELRGIKERISRNSDLKNDYIEELIDKIRFELKKHRLYHLGKTPTPNVGIGFINGICNDFQSAVASAEYISNLSRGCEVYSTYNGTKGIVTDLYKCAKGLLHMQSRPIGLLHNMWDQFFEKNSSEAKFLMVCHSQGAIHVRNALQNYSPELRKRIIVVAIAPGAYIDPETCHQVFHYRASGWKDVVPMIDTTGMEKAKNTVYNLASDSKADLFDHTFRSPTYKAVLASQLRNYLDHQLGYGNFFLF